MRVVNPEEKNEEPGVTPLCTARGEEAPEPFLRGDEGPSDLVVRKGVLQAVLEESRLPETERRGGVLELALVVGVELIEGNCAWSSTTRTSVGLARSEDDTEPGVEWDGVRGLIPPASMVSGLYRGET